MSETETRVVPPLKERKTNKWVIPVSARPTVRPRPIESRGPDSSGRLLKGWETADGWWVTTIHWSDVPGYDYPAACAGLSPEAVQQELEIDWSANPGKRVYKEFGVNHHVSVGPLRYDPHQPLYCGWDFGSVPAFVPTQMNAFGQWLIFPSVSPGENTSTGVYEFGQLVADYLQREFALPNGKTSYRELRLVHYGDPAGAARPPRTGDRPQETQSCFEILDKGLKLYQGADEDGSPRMTRRPGFGFQIRPGAVNVTDRLESVRGRLTQTLRDGLPALVVDKRAVPVIEGFGGGYCYPLRSDGTYGPDPDKNWYSHTMDALAYIATRLFHRPKDEEEESYKKFDSGFRSHASSRYH